MSFAQAIRNALTPRSLRNEFKHIIAHANMSVENAVAAVERAIPSDIVERTELGALKRSRESK